MGREKIMVAMSGGVDSSVAAALLREEGYDVSGVTMRIWPEIGGQAVEDAARVARALGITHHVLDLENEFSENVVKYFMNEYIQGRTPNPCIMCNRFIKFGALLDFALSQGADLMATGHYAQIVFDGERNRYLVKKAVYLEKDQSYVLYRLTPQQLSRVRLPLGKYHKSRVREIAQKLGLPTAAKAESQEICFVTDNSYADFICRHAGFTDRPGDFVDIEGNYLGKHKGIIHYTIGQRKGLGITFGKPMYVVGIDAANSRVILGEKEDSYFESLVADQLNFTAIDSLEGNLRVNAKIRYSTREAPAVISPYGDDQVLVVFDEPQTAVTPGQSVVFYDGDTVVGGGIIKSAKRKAREK